MKNYLLIRFSAMGDVILAAQVARSALLENPDVHLYVLTRKAFRPFFKPEERITFIDVDLKGKHKGLHGLWRLVHETIEKVDLDGVLDVHNVLRSRILGVYFKFKGIPTFHLKKDRKGRRALTRRNNKVLKPLKPITKAMMEVWEKAGILFSLKSINRNEDQIFPKRIGIAPTASTETKTYPFHQMAKLIDLLEGYDLYLFGGGRKDEEVAKALKQSIRKEDLTSLVTGYTLEEQMELMQGMSLMITMDSSNMHLARYLDVPVISIWGATSPLSGYGPVDQPDPSMMVQTEDLNCRPCSIFGQKDCFRGKPICLHYIHPEDILKAVNIFFDRKNHSNPI